MQLRCGKLYEVKEQLLGVLDDDACDQEVMLEPGAVLMFLKREEPYATVIDRILFFVNPDGRRYRYYFNMAHSWDSIIDYFFVEAKKK